MTSKELYVLLDGQGPNQSFAGVFATPKAVTARLRDWHGPYYKTVFDIEGATYDSIEQALLDKSSVELTVKFIDLEDNDIAFTFDCEVIETPLHTSEISQFV